MTNWETCPAVGKATPRRSAEPGCFTDYQAARIRPVREPGERRYRRRVSWNGFQPVDEWKVSARPSTRGRIPEKRPVPVSSLEDTVLIMETPRPPSGETSTDTRSIRQRRKGGTALSTEDLLDRAETGRLRSPDHHRPEHAIPAEPHWQDDSNRGAAIHGMAQSFNTQTEETRRAIEEVEPGTIQGSPRSETQVMDSVTTDTSEKGLESLICGALTGQPWGVGGTRARERPSSYGVGWTRGRPAGTTTASTAWTSRSYPLFCARLSPTTAGALGLGRRRPDAAKVPGPSTGRDHQARHDSTCCAMASGTDRAHIDLLLRHAVAGEREGQDPLRAKTATRSTRQLRYSRDETQLALDLCLFHQRAAGRHVSSSRTASPSRRWKTLSSSTSATVTHARSCSSLDAAWRTSPSTTTRCGFCTHLQGKSSWFSALQPRMGRRRRQSAESLRTQDRLLVEGSADPRRADRHHRELRPDR